MSKNNQPSIVRRSTKGSVVSTTYEFPIRQKKTKTLQEIIYDSSEGTILGRTASSWGKIITFYTIFYIVLAALFTICMAGLYYTLEDEKPKYLLTDSLITSNPGISFTPQDYESADETLQINIIDFNPSDKKSVRKWIDKLDRFFERGYNHNKSQPNVKHCNHGKRNDKEGFVCLPELESFGSCSKDNDYGYSNSAPCIFIKLNRIYGWKPDCYNDIDEIKSGNIGMPEDLIKYIESVPKEERNQIWVSCSGGNNTGQIDYFPSRGFPEYFYPFENQKNYMSPLIAVKFTHPTPQQNVDIECRAWAKNIIYNGSHRERTGSFLFRIHIEKPSEKLIVPSEK